ncbi:MAG: hypothetical protein KC420_15640, partial [Myxococcales bacterium]|nr:hypothetical protein [Myxococcales bacterium]
MGKDDTKHDPPKPEVEDPDRAAILARRQRFIAIALSGLATGSACTKPQPCLNVAPTEPERGQDDAPDAPAQPCP